MSIHKQQVIPTSPYFMMETEHPLFFHNLKSGVFQWNHYIPDQNYFLTSYLLIHIIRGIVTVNRTTIDKKVVTVSLEPHSLLLLCPNSSFTLVSSDLDLEMNYVFFNGTLTPEYLTPSILQNGYFYMNLYFPPLSLQLTRILEYMNSDIHKNISDYSYQVHQFMTDYLTLFHQCLELPSNRVSCPIPGYLIDVKRYLDQNYALTYSLEDIVQNLSISKYKFCHDFTHYYGKPPLQYLNELRIFHAKDLLTTLDNPIHEIGSMVGIDNTNHFINLFKRYVGTTPLQYRQTYTV